MNPVTIFRHTPSEGPGFLVDFLDQQQLPWRLIAIDEGDSLPPLASCSGLVFMGGPMSVNDQLPWINPVLDLIREAVAADIPVLGHCLGGQLMSRALGGVISPNPVKEIGWGWIEPVQEDAGGATLLIQDFPAFEGFHWHGETFSIPAGATRILQSLSCPNQAFLLGKHLALQFHVEMTAAMVQQWCMLGATELEDAAASPAVQTAELMQEQLHQRIEALQAVACTLYSHWIKGLRRAT